jgi:hypothetical protein
MAVALGVSTWGMSVSRPTTVFLTIPPLSILSVPERGLVGREVVVELRPEELREGFLLPLEVRSNVPWAVTARVLSEDLAGVAVEVLGGPECWVGREEIPVLSGRPGKHGLVLLFKMGRDAHLKGAKLVLKILSAS